METERRVRARVLTRSQKQVDRNSCESSEKITTREAYGNQRKESIWKHKEPKGIRKLHTRRDIRGNRQYDPPPRPGQPVGNRYRGHLVTYEWQ